MMSELDEEGKEIVSSKSRVDDPHLFLTTTLNYIQKHPSTVWVIGHAYLSGLGDENSLFAYKHVKPVFSKIIEAYRITIPEIGSKLSMLPHFDLFMFLNHLRMAECKFRSKIMTAEGGHLPVDTLTALTGIKDAIDTQLMAFQGKPASAIHDTKNMLKAAIDDLRRSRDIYDGSGVLNVCDGIPHICTVMEYTVHGDAFYTPTKIEDDYVRENDLSTIGGSLVDLMFSLGAAADGHATLCVCGGPTLHIRMDASRELEQEKHTPLLCFGKLQNSRFLAVRLREILYRRGESHVTRWTLLLYDTERKVVEYIDFQPSSLLSMTQEAKQSFISGIQTLALKVFPSATAAPEILAFHRVHKERGHTAYDFPANHVDQYRKMWPYIFLLHRIRAERLMLTGEKLQQKLAKALVNKPAYARQFACFLALKTQYAIATCLGDIGDYLTVTSMQLMRTPLYKKDTMQLMRTPLYKKDTIQLIQELVLDVYGTPEEEQRESVGYAPMYTDKNRHSPQSVSLSSSASSSPIKSSDPVMSPVSLGPSSVYRVSSVLTSSADAAISVGQYKKALDAALVIINKLHKTAPMTVKEVFAAYVRQIGLGISSEKIDVLKNNIALIPQIIKNKEIRNTLITALETKLLPIAHNIPANEKWNPVVEELDSIRDPPNRVQAVEAAIARKYSAADPKENNIEELVQKVLTGRIKSSMRKFGSKLFGTPREAGRILPSIPRYVDVMDHSHVNGEPDPILPYSWQLARVDPPSGLFPGNALVNLFYLVQGVSICFGDPLLVKTADDPSQLKVSKISSHTCDMTATRFIAHNIYLLASEPGHANLILIDTHKKTIERFEPHGIKEVLPGLDAALKQAFSSLYKDHQWTYYAPVDYMPCNIILQESDEMCTVWPYLYILLRVQYPEMPRDMLLLKMERDIRDDQSYIYKFHHYISMNLQKSMFKATGDAGLLTYKDKRQQTRDYADRSYAANASASIVRLAKEYPAKRRRTSASSRQDSGKRRRSSSSSKQDSAKRRPESSML
jgi:hypothetical protein